MPLNENTENRLSTYFRLRFPYFFISLLLALHSVYLYSLSFSQELTHFGGRMIGIGALESFDVTARVTFFYKAVFLLIIVFFAFNAIINSLIFRKRLNDFEALPVSWISALGCGGFVTQITIATGLMVSQLALLSFVPFLCLVIIRNLFKRFPDVSSNSGTFFIWIYMLAFILSILTGYFFDAGTHTLVILTVLYTTLLASAMYLFKTGENRYYLLVRTWIPAAWIPVLLVISSELAMILNQRSISFAGSLFFTAVALLSVAAVVAYRFYKFRKKDVPSAHSSLHGYFPWLIAGMAAWFLWQPAIQATTELFEIANPANALMHIFSFNDIPLLQFFNSHLFSEIIPGFFYFLLNCYDGSQAFLLYNFIEYIAIVLLAYYVIAVSTGSRITGFLFSVFVPFIPELTDERMFLSLITLFALLKVYQNASVKNSIVYWIAVFAVCLYSPDMAPSAIVALLATALFTPGFLTLFPFRKIVKSLLWVITPILLILTIIVVATGTPVFSNFHNAIQYLTAGNAHGVVSVWPEMNRTVMAQYFLLPFVVLVILVYVVSRRKVLSAKSPFLYSFMVFMAVFYFVNFQRGLLRHGFNEGHDGFVVSFGFLIVALTPYLFSKIKEIYRHLIFFALSFYLVWQWGYPEPSGNQNLFESAVTASTSRMHIKGGQEPMMRVIPQDVSFRKTIREFIAFTENHLQPGQTFGDFSYSPALYYYSQRPVPGYFCQGIHNAATETQQRYTIETFSRHDLPYFVMSNIPAHWFDAMDGVPNYVRHYRIAEYVFARYRPWKIIGGHSVWKRNDVAAPVVAYANDSITDQPPVYHLRLLPRFWAEYGSNHAVELLQVFTASDFEQHYGTHYTVLSDSLPSGRCCYADAEISDDSGIAQEYILDYGNDWVVFGEFRFTVLNRKPVERYRFRMSTQYPWHHRKVNFIRIRPADATGQAKLNALKIFDAD